MNILNVKISNERLSTDRKVMISNSVNYEHAFFTFDSEWDNLEKIATFTNTVTKVEKPMAVNPTTNMCVVPWECISKDGYLVICVKGSKTFADPAEDVVVYTKMEDPIKILKSDMGTGGSEPLPPTEDIISQIKAIADEALVKSTNAENIATGIMEMANNGDFDGRGILNTAIDQFGFLLVYYNDGTYENVGSVVGHDAVGISSSVIVNGNLIITYTDGDIVNVGRVVGADGTDGEDGLDGKSLEYNWDGTRLGIRVVGDLEYVYQELNPYITAIDGDVFDEDSLLFKDNSDSLLKKISFFNIKAKLKEYFDALYDSALHILSRVKEVDGVGSGLDSDFVDGMDTSYTASANTVVVRGADGSSEFNSINLDATPDISALKVGSVYYDADEVGLSVKVSDDVTIQVNKESYETLYNDDTVQIPNGSVVYWSSAIGASGFMRAKRFIGDGTVDSERMVGVATQDVPIGEKGIITSKGKVRNINTSGSLYGETWVDGEVLYASPTIAGGLTKIKPSKPNNVIKIGEVIRSHSSIGILYVNPIVIYGTGDLEIDDLSPSLTKTYSSQKIESISGGGSYTLPTMSETIKGGAKIGNNLEIVDDILNVTGVVTQELDPTVPLWAKQETKPTYTKSEIGLGSVDNTSDADKPISSSVQAIFNSHIGSGGASHALATDILPGFISPEEKIKLRDVIYNDVGVIDESLVIDNILNATSSNVLSDKRILFIGDSICEGVGADTDGTGIKKPYSYWIQEWNKTAVVTNAGHGGMTVANNVGTPTNSYRYRIDNGEYTQYIGNVDMIILEGGINDLMNNNKLGYITKSFNLNKMSTFCGGLEYALNYFKTNFKNIPIGFISTHNVMAYDYNKQQGWWGALSEVCAKYGVGFLDIFSLVTTPYIEGLLLHPDYTVHRDYYAPQILKWLKNGMQSTASKTTNYYKINPPLMLSFYSGKTTFDVGETIVTTDWRVNMVRGDLTTYVNLQNSPYKERTFVDTSFVDTSIAGSYKVPFTYTEDGITIEIEVPVTVQAVTTKTLSSISAIKTDTSYTVGETLVTNDIVTTAHYSDSTTTTVTPASIDISAVNMSVAGTYNITITYTESGVTKTTTIAITVSAVAKVLDSITATKTDQSYTVGETLVTSDITVTAHYTDTTTAVVTPASIDVSAVNMSTVGTYEIGISYTENNVTKTTTLSVTVDASSNIASGTFNDSNNQPTGSWVLETDGKLTITTSSATNVGMPSTWTATTMPWYAYISQILSVEYVGKWTNTGNNALYGATNLTTVVLSSTITTVSASSFYNAPITSMNLTNVTSILTYGLRGSKFTSLTLGACTLGTGAFYGAGTITQVTFTGTPTSIATDAFVWCSGITSIRVPWASGVVANAPWGATAATITYNWTA